MHLPWPASPSFCASGGAVSHHQRSVPALHTSSCEHDGALTFLPYAAVSIGKSPDQSLPQCLSASAGHGHLQALKRLVVGLESGLKGKVQIMYVFLLFSSFEECKSSQLFSLHSIPVLSYDQVSQQVMACVSFLSLHGS